MAYTLHFLHSLRFSLYFSSFISVGEGPIYNSSALLSMRIVWWRFADTCPINGFLTFLGLSGLMGEEYCSSQSFK